MVLLPVARGRQVRLRYEPQTTCPTGTDWPATGVSASHDNRFPATSRPGADGRMDARSGAESAAAPRCARSSTASGTVTAGRSRWLVQRCRRRRRTARRRAPTARRCSRPSRPVEPSQRIYGSRSHGCVIMERTFADHSPITPTLSPYVVSRHRVQRRRNRPGGMK